MRVIPVLGARGAPLAEVAAACAAARGLRRCCRPGTGDSRASTCAQLLTVAWLRGRAVYLPAALLVDVGGA